MEYGIPKLPLRATVRRSYRLAWDHRMEYVRIARWWLALAVPIAYAYVWLIWNSIQSMLCFDAGSDSVPSVLDADFFIRLPLDLFMLFFGASIAVAWHRLILRNEQVAARRYLRFDRVVWHYFLFGAAFMVLPMLVMAAVSPSSTDYQSGAGMLAAKTLAMVIGGLAAMYVIVRLSVILPATALARGEITVGEVWRRTSGNFWRLFIGGALCTLPVILVGVPLSGCHHGLTGVTLYTLSLFLYTVFAMPVELTFLSLSYQHFFERQDAS